MERKGIVEIKFLINLLPPECAVCVCVCDNKIRVPVRNHIMSQTSVNLTPCCTKHIKVLRLLRYQGWTYRSILSLSKMVHQMWCAYPFKQRNRTPERTVGVGAGGDREVVGVVDII